jgi:Zn2+/Cd2+-exporting ATPase
MINGNIKDDKMGNGKTVKKEIILEGLNCAYCASKIEKEISGIDGIDLVSMNFIEKKLTLEISNPNLENTIDTISKLINKIEPDVVIKEKEIAKSNRKIFLLTGICCELCADNVEKEIRNIDGVKNAVLDFEKGALSIEFYNRRNEKKILKEARETAKNIISKIKIIDEDSRTKNLNYLSLIKDAAAFLIFILAFFIDAGFTVKLTLYLISYLLIGSDILFKAGRNIIKGQVFDENFLMSIATIGAFAIRQYPEAVAVMLFYKAGMYLEKLAVDRSKKSIGSLMDLRPDYANLKTDGGILKVSPEEVKIGDMIVVKPGERIPLDGVINEGTSVLDVSALTGESLPKEVSAGMEILSGSINKSGLLSIKVIKEYKNSAVAKIEDLLKNSGSKKSVTEKFITKFARIYTPVIVVLAFLIASVPPLLTGAKFEDWLYRALIFLVVSCPCALVLSIPIGFIGGIGSAGRKGVLVKGSNYLDGLNNVDTVVFDKTGTLTEGKLAVTEVKPESGFTEDGILRYAAYSEIYSNHPIAFSILKKYGKDIDRARIGDFIEQSGYGVMTFIDGRKVICGNEKMLTKELIKFDSEDLPGTVVHIAVDGKYAGYILISDEIKKEAADMIGSLKKAGIKKTVILTGDNKYIAGTIAKSLGITEFYPDLLPDQKVEILEKIENDRIKNSKVVYVGDGINDAPVIARADIGIAMGGIGSDIAVESADIVIMNDRISKIPELFGIAKKTKSIVIQNIILALGIKVIVLVLGAGGLATMWEAVFADVGVAIIAILNSLRALRIK